MCCDLIFVILVCKHVGEMVQEKGRNPLPYQVLMAVGWIGGEIIGAIVGILLAIVIGNDNDDVAGLIITAGVIIGLACGAGPAYLLAANVTRDPNYRRPQPAPGASPYGPSPYGPPPGPVAPSANPYHPPAQNLYGSPASTNPFAESPASPAPPAAPPPGGAAAAPGIPSFLPATAFAPANAGPKRVQFYCPGGHLLEEWSTSAGEQRRCPHCGGVAMVPLG